MQRASQTSQVATHATPATANRDATCAASWYPGRVSSAAETVKRDKLPRATRGATDRRQSEALVAYYFRVQRRFERSTLGDMLERAQSLRVGSDGRRIRQRRRAWNWQPEGMVVWNGRLQRTDDAPGPPMLVHAAHSGGPAYEVDDEDLVRFARASRRMLAVERRSPQAKRALEAYYGDRGSFWAAYSSDVFDSRGGLVHRGAGPGAIAALYVLTPAGAVLVERERAKSAEIAGDRGAEHLTDDQVLATVFALQAAEPQRTRQAMLNRVRDQAEKLLLEALGMWQGADPGLRRNAA